MERIFKGHKIIVKYTSHFEVSCYRRAWRTSPPDCGFNECIFAYDDKISLDMHEAMNVAKIHLSTGLKLKIY